MPAKRSVLSTAVTSMVAGQVNVSNERSVVFSTSDADQTEHAKRQPANHQFAAVSTNELRAMARVWRIVVLTPNDVVTRAARSRTARGEFSDAEWACGDPPLPECVDWNNRRR